MVIVILAPIRCISQKTALFELSAGAGSGWWNYDKGEAEDNSGHLGWDHTSTRAFINTEVDVIFKINRWAIGPGAKLVFFLDNDMLAGEHSQYNYSKYPIALRNVQFFQYYVLSEYDLYNGKKFLFSPSVKVGSFLIDTIHPRSEQMGFSIFFEAGASNQISLAKNLFLVLRPSLQMMRIWGNEDARDGEKHQLFNLNINAGLRYAI